jgi:uncharacterized protein (DUF1501 family)
MSDRKFVFVFANGGWDPTMVFAPLFGQEGIDVESEATTETAGSISFVAHEERPSVSAFFQAYHERAVILNGVEVPSVTHDMCRKLILTGTVEENMAGWPTLIARAQSERYVVPSMVLTGPSFPGPYGTLSARVGQSSQLDRMLDSQIFLDSDVALSAPSVNEESVMDAFMADRAAARAALTGGSELDRRLAEQFQQSLDRMLDLKAMRGSFDLDLGQGFSGQCTAAVEALSKGLCRCVSVSRSGWDTHGDNFVQSTLYEDVFAGMLQIMSLLESTPGEFAPTLAEETVLVAISEMGRAPLINARRGKDHWPNTSVLMVGPGLTGDRVVGAYDGRLNGVPVDRATGDIVGTGRPITANTFGATLLQLAGIDSGVELPGVLPLSGILT